MAKVIISSSLKEKIYDVFKGESTEVLELLLTLEDNPRKGKLLGSIKGILIKEIKYKNYRFYFLVDGFKIKFLKNDELKDIVIKIINMSNKNNQQNIIDKIKAELKKVGFDGF